MVSTAVDACDSVDAVLAGSSLPTPAADAPTNSLGQPRATPTTRPDAAATARGDELAPYAGILVLIALLTIAGLAYRLLHHVSKQPPYDLVRSAPTAGADDAMLPQPRVATAPQASTGQTSLQGTPELADTNDTETNAPLAEVPAAIDQNTALPSGGEQPAEAARLHAELPAPESPWSHWRDETPPATPLIQRLPPIDEVPAVAELTGTIHAPQRHAKHEHDRPRVH